MEHVGQGDKLRRDPAKIRGHHQQRGHKFGPIAKALPKEIRQREEVHLPQLFRVKCARDQKADPGANGVEGGPHRSSRSNFIGGGEQCPGAKPRGEERGRRQGRPQAPSGDEKVFVRLDPPVRPQCHAKEGAHVEQNRKTQARQRTASTQRALSMGKLLNGVTTCHVRSRSQRRVRTRR